MPTASLADHARLRKLTDNIRPIGVDAYVDLVRIWLKRPLTERKRKQLERQYGVRLLVFDERMRFHSWYVQRLHFLQPSRDELKVIGQLVHKLGGLFNGAEISWDMIFANPTDCREAERFVSRHHVVKQRGPEQRVKWSHGTTRYSAEQGAPNVTVIYRDKLSRVRQCENCLHMDWRINGIEALERGGIYCIEDLLELDYREFWEPRLLFYAVDPRLLGKRIHQHVLGKGRRHGARIVYYGEDKRFRYDVDYVIGAATIKLAKESQRLIDQFRGQFDVNECLVTIPTPSQWLPSRNGVSEKGQELPKTASKTERKAWSTLSRRKQGSENEEYDGAAM